MISRKSFWLFAAILTGLFTSSAQNTGDYQSKRTGIWNDSTAWERYNGTSWVAASVAPADTNGVITIKNGDTVTVDADVTVDQIVVAAGAALTVDSATFLIKDTINTVYGTLRIVHGGEVGVDTLNVVGGSLEMDSGTILDAASSTYGTVRTFDSSSITVPSDCDFAAWLFVQTGTTTLLSPTSTGALQSMVYVGRTNGVPANLILADGKDFVFNGSLTVRPFGIIHGPGTMTYSGDNGPDEIVFTNNGIVEADVVFHSLESNPQFLQGSWTPGATAWFWNNVEINNASGVTLSYSHLLAPGGARWPVATIGGTFKLTNGTFTNRSRYWSADSQSVRLGDGATIVRSDGSLSEAPFFGTSVNVEYTGTSAVTTSFELPSSTSILNNLTINNSGGVTLDSDCTVNGTLTLTNGNVTLDDNTLTIGSAGSISGASSSNYIATNAAGYLVQNVPATNTNVVFPVGTTATYNPLILNNHTGTMDTYSVRVANSTANIGDAANAVGNQWTIKEEVDGGSNVTLTAQWNVGEEGTSFGGSRASALIGRYLESGTSWSLLGTSVSGAGPYTARTTSLLTGAGIFTNSVYGIGLAGALPVQMISFIGVTKGNKIQLTWKTATELNSSAFEIERRTAGDWKKIGELQAAGTSNASREYTYVDEMKNIGSSNILYRLKTIDTDGSFKYSGEVEVTAVPQSYELRTNFPNPFNPQTKIQYSLPENAQVHLSVYDVIGRQVADLVNEEQSAGYYEKTFTGSNLSSGLYFYRITAQAQGKNVFSQVKKMLLVK